MNNLAPIKKGPGDTRLPKLDPGVLNIIEICHACLVSHKCSSYKPERPDTFFADL